MTRKIALLTIMMWVIITYSTPTWMDVGTYALSNGPTGCNPLTSITYTAWKFYSYAHDYHPGGPAAYHLDSLEDYEVTISTVNGTTSWSKYCDFVWVGCHGDVRELYLWNASGNNYEVMTPSQMAFGTSYTRWVYLGGCHVLKYDNYDDFFVNPESWKDACKGVQCILGFSSVGYPLDSDQWEVFWPLWTGGNDGQGPQYGMWGAYYWAVHDIIYVEDEDDVAPALITSRDWNGHYFWNDTYQQATSTQAVPWATGTIWAVFGDPQ